LLNYIVAIKFFNIVTGVTHLEIEPYRRPLYMFMLQMFDTGYL